MAQRRKKPKSKKTQSKKQETTVPEGILLLASSVIILLSLFGFYYTPGSYNTLGLIGHSIGWLFTAILGLGSYILCIFLAWTGWRLTFEKPINNRTGKLLHASLFLLSFCMLLTLIENQWPAAHQWFARTFYPALWKKSQYYHLGGAGAQFFYQDLPGLNLKYIINHIGVGIIFTTTFLISGIYLLKIDPSLLLNWVKEKGALLREKLRRPPRVVGATKEKTSLMRFVKFRGNDSSPSPDSGMLAIEPEMNLTARPSISRKNDPLPSEPYSGEPSRLRTPPTPAPAPEPAPRQTKREKAITAQRVYNGDYTQFKLPPQSLLTDPKYVDQSSLKRDLKRQAEVLEETLQSFSIEARVGQINCGPTITSFEVHPSIGVKVQRIKALENDIALNMEAKSIRIIAPIPGKAAVGIEVPNPQPQEVSFKEMLRSYQKQGTRYKIPLMMGKAVSGDSILSDLARMPHLLIAGATGSGKSVCINTIVMSILMTARPDEIKMIMIDPKKVELTPYTNLPHMLAPVITEPQGACAALKWLVKEMEDRYELCKQCGVRNIESFNNRTISDDEAEETPKRLPYILCIIDELADLMMVAHNDIETPIARIAQMARAVGIHLVLATQRPSREVITGLIKANFPTRISFKVSSRINSQIVLDEVGAESLLGNGDMLFLPPGTSQTIRAQGSFIRDDDINKIVSFVCDQAPPNYVIESFDQMNSLDGDMDDEPADALYSDALEVILSTGNASTTFLQRKLKIGYARAAGIIDEMEARGVVGPAEGSKPRKILVRGAEASAQDPSLFD